MTVTVVNTTSNKTSTHDSVLFDRQANPLIVAQAVRVYLSNQRAGLAHTKTRGEVDLTTKKWFKQKGTGNARHGAQSAPIFVGGGVAHGPRGNANFKLSMSKTMKRIALQTAFGMQAANGKIRIVEGLADLKPKTKDVAVFLKSINAYEIPVLLIVDSISEELARATRNIETLMVMSADSVNTYAIMRAHQVLMTAGAVTQLEQRFTKNIEATPAKKAVAAKKLAKAEKPAAAIKPVKKATKKVTKEA